MGVVKDSFPAAYNFDFNTGQIIFQSDLQKTQFSVNVKERAKRRGAMRHFYELVRVDAQTKRFYASCPVCEQKAFLGKLPILCRNSKRLSDCRAGKGGCRQLLYNRCTAIAVRRLSLHFNRCNHCGSWVCDNCFFPDSEDGICIKCNKQPKEES